MFWIAANLQKHSGSGWSHPWLLDDSTRSCVILVFWVFFFSFVMLEIQDLASIPHPNCMSSLHYPQDRVNSIIVPLFLWSPNHSSQSSLPYPTNRAGLLHRFPMPWVSVRTSNGETCEPVLKAQHGVRELFSNHSVRCDAASTKGLRSWLHR